MDFLKDLFGFLWQRKAYWIMPIVLILLVIGALLFFGGGTAVAPFIYSFF